MCISFFKLIYLWAVGIGTHEELQKSPDTQVILVLHNSGVTLLVSSLLSVYKFLIGDGDTVATIPFKNLTTKDLCGYGEDVIFT